MFDRILPYLTAIWLRLTQGSYSATAIVQRAANTTQYTALDVVGALLSFNRIGPVGGKILITSAEIELDIASVPITNTMTTLVLHLYTGQPGLLVDNGAWDLTAGDRNPLYCGNITFLAPTDLGSTLYSQLDSINMQRALAENSDTLYGYLVTTTGYTPAANSESYKVTLHSLAV